MASASSGLALRIRIRRGLGGGGGGGRGFAAAATDDSDGRGGRGRRRDASPVIVLFPCLLLERERKRESCLSGKRAVVACVRPRTLPPLPLRSEKQSEREKLRGARFFRLCFCLEFFPLLVNSRLDLVLVLFSPPRGPLSFLFHFSPCLSLFDTTKPASHGPGFRSGALPPRQENRGEARRRARRRASSSGSSRSFVLAFVVVVAVRCTPRAASAIPPCLGPRREHQHFYPRGATRERSLPPTRLRRKRRSTGGGREREREKERKKKRPCI